LTFAHKGGFVAFTGVDLATGQLPESR
jgi:hypothetical protein